MFINTFIHNIKYGVNNLKYWFPIIWKDRDWDHSFLYEMLRHKLSSMEKSFNNGNFVGCEKEAKNIKLCVNLLDRLIKDDYINDELYEKYINTDVSKITNKEEYLIKQDLEMLFDTLKKRIRFWWD